jgi:hypothetical protein
VGGVEKKIKAEVCTEAEQEVGRLIDRLMDQGQQGRAVDLEASETAVRAAMHEFGGRLLQRVLNADQGAYRGWRTDCGAGHKAQFVGYRDKQLQTVLAKVQLQRAYYYCAVCRAGVIPKDVELDVAGTCFSPGVRRMIGRVGAKEAFDEGRQDLKELAGIVVKTKAVERISEVIGEQAERVFAGERRGALAGWLAGIEAASTFYIAIDGTGVPVVARESEGRKGKRDTERAKTREAKLGCVFTQTLLDDQGRPRRDEHSTTYVGAIESAEQFGPRIYAEAVRRGLGRAGRVVVVGDGATWIWNIADEHFHGAIQIVDLYHARQHLTELAKSVYGQGTPKATDWAAGRSQQLDAGNIEAVLTALRRLRPRDGATQKAVQSTLRYFQNNAHRMRYADFRSQSLFVGSGVVEAGCKTVIGHRLKQSGMQWTVRGANAIIALRCLQLSGRWEEFWETRAAG